MELTAFMPFEPGSAFGPLDFLKEERRSLAIQSRETPAKYETPQRQILITKVNPQESSYFLSVF